jgi:hypothetical protein
MRSISTLPMARLTHSAAFGSVVLEEDLGGGLREHDLGQVPIDHFQLGLALETQNDGLRDLRFSVMAVCSCGSLLQAGQLVDHKPHRMLVRPGRTEQAENEHVDPKTVQRTKSFAFGGLRSNEDPSLSILRPLACCPFGFGFGLRWQQTETVGDEAQRAEYAHR